MSKSKTAVEAWEQALAAIRKLPLKARIHEEGCDKLLKWVRAGDFSAELERAVRNCGEGLLNYLKIIQELLEPEGMGH
jgi:hypothetical protein